PLRNPIILGAGLGALVSATGVRPPAVIAHPVELLGAAAVPTALLTLGMSLRGRPATDRGARAETWVTVLIKNLFQPLATLAAGALLLYLPPHQLLAVVLLAALPTAQNVFTYAREYGLDTAPARDAILASTLLSMLTLSGIAWFLGRA